MLDPLDPRTLKSAREAAGLRRSELAKQAGVNETTILRIEKGEVDPKLDGTWRPLVNALRTLAAAPASTIAICPRCDERADQEVALSCTSAHCPMRQREAA